MSLLRCTVVVAGVLAAGPVSAQSGRPLERFDPAADAPRFARVFREYSVRPGRAVTLSPQGMAFELAATPNAGHVGARAGAMLAGDFAVEVRYEVATLPETVTTGYGVLFGLSVTAPGTDGSASLVRGVYKEGSQLSAGRALPQPKGTHYASRRFPTDAKAGRLGLRRVKDEIIAIAADTPTGDWVELNRYPFPTEPVEAVNLYADTGGAAAELKGRLYDLRVVSGGPVSLADVKKGPAGKTFVPLPMPAPQKKDG